jgi:hypothetical protein
MLPIDINKTIGRMNTKANEEKKANAIDYRHSIQGTANQIVGESMQSMSANGNQMQQSGEVYAQ